jgi:hypothetical protein
LNDEKIYISADAEMKKTHSLKRSKRKKDKKEEAKAPDAIEKKNLFLYGT